MTLLGRLYQIFRTYFFTIPIMPTYTTKNHTYFSYFLVFFGIYNKSLCEYDELNWLQICVTEWMTQFTFVQLHNLDILELHLVPHSIPNIFIENENPINSNSIANFISTYSHAFWGSHVIEYVFELNIYSCSHSTIGSTRNILIDQKPMCTYSNSASICTTGNRE